MIDKIRAIGLSFSYKGNRGTLRVQISKSEVYERLTDPHTVGDDLREILNAYEFSYHEEVVRANRAVSLFMIESQRQTRTVLETIVNSGGVFTDQAGDPIFVVPDDQRWTDLREGRVQTRGEQGELWAVNPRQLPPELKLAIAAHLEIDLDEKGEVAMFTNEEESQPPRPVNNDHGAHQEEHPLSNVARAPEQRGGSDDAHMADSNDGAPWPEEGGVAAKDEMAVYAEMIEPPHSAPWVETGSGKAPAL